MGIKFLSFSGQTYGQQSYGTYGQPTDTSYTQPQTTATYGQTAYATSYGQPPTGKSRGASRGLGKELGSAPWLQSALCLTGARQHSWEAALCLLLSPRGESVS